VNQKVLPWPGLLSAHILPLCRPTICLDKYKPMPRPDTVELVSLMR
jgi:hypothetical protein